MSKFDWLFVIGGICLFFILGLIIGYESNDELKYSLGFSMMFISSFGLGRCFKLYKDYLRKARNE